MMSISSLDRIVSCTPTWVPVPCQMCHTAHIHIKELAKLTFLPASSYVSFVLRTFSKGLSLCASVAQLLGYWRPRNATATVEPHAIAQEANMMSEVFLRNWDACLVLFVFLYVLCTHFSRRRWIVFVIWVLVEWYVMVRPLLARTPVTYCSHFVGRYKILFKFTLTSFVLPVRLFRFFDGFVTACT